jgi:hypothetical protein
MLAFVSYIVAWKSFFLSGLLLATVGRNGFGLDDQLELVVVIAT